LGREDRKQKKKEDFKMARGINKFKEWIGIGDEYDEETEEEIEGKEPEESEEFDEAKKPIKKVKKSVSMPSSFTAPKKGNFDASFVVSKPKSFEDSKEICDKLKQRKGVYLNLEGIDKVLAQRIVDFIGGSVYALEGNIRKVASSGFIVVPDNISISSEIDEKEDISDENYSWMK
jgi:cell division inhibitor SepF